MQPIPIFLFGKSVDRGAWVAAPMGLQKSWAQLSNQTTKSIFKKKYSRTKYFAHENKLLIINLLKIKQNGHENDQL